MTVVVEERDERGVVTITLDRPEVRNAFDPELMRAIRAAFERAAGDNGVRVIVLTGAGSAFSAGANLDWMRSMKQHSYEDNLADSRELDALFRTIDTCPRPVVARVNGHALGGAIGLIACADVAVAVEGATFGFTEVRLGLAPAVISTYVKPKLGLSQARRYFLTGEHFDAARALMLGLVHEVCAPEQLDAATGRIVDDLLAAGPTAQAAMKQLVRDVDAALPDREAAAEQAIEVIARLRVGEEGQEGMDAFFDDRPPTWAERAD